MAVEGNMGRRGANLWDHLAIIVKWRKLFMGLLGLVAVASVVYTLVIPVYFTSNSKLLPPPTNGMGLGSMLPGLNIGALGVGSLLSNESNLAINILESRILQDAVIDSFRWMELKKYKYRDQAYKRYSKLIRWELTEDGAISLMVEEEGAERAYQTATFIVDYVRREYTLISSAQAGNQREFIEKRLNENYLSIENAEQRLQDFQEKTGVISVEDQLRVSVEAVAQLSTELYLAEVQLDVYRKTLPKGSTEVLIAQQQVESLRRKLEEMNRAGERESTDFFISINEAPEVGIQFFRLQRELETQALILQFLLPQYEQARILELQDTSNMYLLDPPNLPDRKSRPKRAFIVVGLLIAAFALLYILVAFVEWLRKLRESDADQYRSVQYVIDHLHPTRFFGRERSDLEA